LGWRRGEEEEERERKRGRDELIFSSVLGARGGVALSEPRSKEMEVHGGCIVYRVTSPRLSLWRVVLVFFSLGTGGIYCQERADETSGRRCEERRGIMFTLAVKRSRVLLRSLFVFSTCKLGQASFPGKGSLV
jgi:hypothetical protein